MFEKCPQSKIKFLNITIITHAARISRISIIDFNLLQETVSARSADSAFHVRLHCSMGKQPVRNIVNVVMCCQTWLAAVYVS